MPNICQPFGLHSVSNSLPKSTMLVVSTLASPEVHSSRPLAKTHTALSTSRLGAPGAQRKSLAAVFAVHLVQRRRRALGLAPNPRTTVTASTRNSAEPRASNPFCSIELDR